MKKIISLILCLIFAFSFAVSAFAATDNSNGTFLPQGPNNWVGNNPSPNRPSFDATNPPKNSEGIKDIVPEEENPNTGAPVVLAVPAVITLVGTVAVITKRK